MKRIAVSLLIIFPVCVLAQSLPVNDIALGKKYSFISPVHNFISNSSGLDSFYRKLQQLKSGQINTVSIVHIGDSHIQADSYPGVVRAGLQGVFGDAGRGLVFPYQLAQSNSPDDISSSSNTRWQFNRLAHPEIPLPYGISGHGIKTMNSGATINLSLKTLIRSFSRLKFFTDDSSVDGWVLQAENNDSSYVLKKAEEDLYHEVNLVQPATRFSLSSMPSEMTKAFYGVSLENANPGIIYHTIGVNGARYDHYNKAELFWEQLPALNADLFIISLGTNEAQNTIFAESAFTRELTAFLQKLQQASPGASVLITTAADSYKKRRLNAVLRQLNASLANYCNRNRIAFWDLYRITNGFGSANSWMRHGLMNRDRIHFTPEGYRVQGGLLLAAMAKGFNGKTSEP
jgi:lysophospholipase L1-like esterase